MSRVDTLIELNNLRLVFSAIGLGGEVLDELRAATGISRAVAGLLVRSERRGPPAADVFPPFERRPLPSLAGKRIGILASGGAGATASLVGVQRAFEEADLAPAAISLCSGATLFGILWAAGLTADEVARFWLGLRDRDYLDPDWAALARAVPVFRGWGGVLRGAALERSFARRLRGLKLGETPIAVSAVVWNIDENRVEHIGTRQTPDIPVARAARVAIAIPLLVAPVEIGGHVYGDGGIVDIFPATPLVDQDLDRVLGINCYYREGFAGDDRSGFLDRSFSVVRASGQLRWAAHLELARERARALGDRLSMIQPVPHEETRGARFFTQFLDRSSWPRAMRLGRLAARAALERWAAAAPVAAAA
jgi:NTE family protein